MPYCKASKVLTTSATDHRPHTTEPNTKSSPIMNTPPTTGLSPNQRALLKIRDLKQQVEDLKSAHARSAFGGEIAIVSMACRFPRSANTPEAFWQSLVDQTDVRHLTARGDLGRSATAPADGSRLRSARARRLASRFHRGNDWCVCWMDA